MSLVCGLRAQKVHTFKQFCTQFWLGVHRFPVDMEEFLANERSQQGDWSAPQDSQCSLVFVVLFGLHWVQPDSCFRHFYLPSINPVSPLLNLSHCAANLKSNQELGTHFQAVLSSHTFLVGLEMYWLNKTSLKAETRGAPVLVTSPLICAEAALAETKWLGIYCSYQKVTLVSKKMSIHVAILCGTLSMSSLEAVLLMLHYIFP